MDNLQDLQSLGFSLPSPAYLFGAIVFGIIGFAAWRYGKKAGRKWTKWLGVALMVYPYAISQTWLLYVAGVALCAALFFDPGRRAGDLSD
jgi:chromate transport protein ChrA